jgi:hypothetical protein
MNREHLSPIKFSKYLEVFLLRIIPLLISVHTFVVWKPILVKYENGFLHFILNQSIVYVLAPGKIVLLSFNGFEQITRMAMWELMTVSQLQVHY